MLHDFHKNWHVRQSIWHIKHFLYTMDVCISLMTNPN